MSVAIVSGSRADYGLLKPLIDRLDGARVYLTGGHLSKKLGYTVSDVEGPHCKTEVVLDSDTDVGVAKSIGLGVLSFTDTFDRDQPDLVIVLGDRYEIFAVAQAAFTLKIPLAHIAGGELTNGLLDDGYRYSISCMADYHFTQTENAQAKICRLNLIMGKNLQNVHWVGALGLEDLPRPAEKKNQCLVMYHPTKDDSVTRKEMKEIVNAIRDIPFKRIYAIGGNADALGFWVQHEFSMKGHVEYHAHLPRNKFLKVLNESRVAIGNSSCLLIEAPNLRVPTVNVGIRQGGREKGPSVIDDNGNIKGAIEKAFRVIDFTNPYDAGGKASEKIVDVLSQV